MNFLHLFLKDSHTTEEGHTDDLAMCCVLFAWLVQQTYFKELTDDDIRARMFLEQQHQLEQDIISIWIY